MDGSAIVVGLGNPGERYRSTRHNVGFWVVDRLAGRFRCEFAARGESGRLVRTARAVVAGREVVLAKPRTYMNRSGKAVAALLDVGGRASEAPVLVYDDADLELGRIRVRFGGGAGGHNGVRSVIERLGDGDFARIRLGVRGAARDEMPLADYVLAPFAPEEIAVANELADLGAEAVVSLVEHGLQTTMNRFNGLKATTLQADERAGEEHE